jgi:hypothetical protein
MLTWAIVFFLIKATRDKADVTGDVGCLFGISMFFDTIIFAVLGMTVYYVLHS